MATVSLTIPDANLTAVLSAFQASYPGDWAAAQSAGLTGAQFCKQKVAEYVKAIYQAQLAQTAAESARVASLATTASVIIT